MERRSDWAEVCPVDAHLIERFCIHDVEAVASIHQYFHESLLANNRVDYKRISSWVRDVVRMDAIRRTFSSMDAIGLSLMVQCLFYSQSLTLLVPSPSRNSVSAWYDGPLQQGPTIYVA